LDVSAQSAPAEGQRPPTQGSCDGGLA